MRLSLLGVSSLATIVATLAIGFDATASTQPSPTPAGSAHGDSTANVVRTCYEQLDGDSFQGIVSQNFEPSFDAYDTQGADDFPLDKACRPGAVTALGTYFGGAGPIESVNVTIYRSRHSRPASVERQLVGAAYTDVCGGNGCPMVTMKGRLRPGRHWVSVQANMDFSAGGEWGWMTNNTVRGRKAKWQNPGDGFATGCTTYSDLLSCIDNGEGGDFAFSLGTSTPER